MTSFHSRLQLGAPIASALITALVLGGTLWVQRTRAAWPFEQPAHQAGMDGGGTVAATGGPHTAHARVAVDAAAASALDVRLETVAHEMLTQTVRAVATVVPDESRISHVHTRVSGWVERLDVNTTGEMVRAGEPVARIFSQELLSSQTEYLAARRNVAASGITSAVVAGGRARLAVFGMTAGEIDAIEQDGEPRRLVTVVAPRTGIVVNRGVTAGTSVDPSTTLLTIADLSRVWVLAEIPEANIAAVRVGSVAQLDFPASGHPPFRARIEFASPTLTERTRTLRVRLSAPNRHGALRPGLYGTAVFEFAARSAMSVPLDAVVDSGAEQHVFVAVGDRYEPRTVTLGARVGDRIEIRSGLAHGEQVVASGVFLLDSESRLRATGGAGGHQHGDPSTNGQRATPDPSSHTDPHAGHREH